MSAASDLALIGATVLGTGSFCLFARLAGIHLRSRSIRQYRINRRLEQSCPHILKPLTPFQRALVAERAAARDYPLGEEAHTTDPIDACVTELRSVVPRLARRAS